MAGLFANSKVTQKSIFIGNEYLQISFIDDLDLILETKTANELSETCPFGGVIWPSSVALCNWVAHQLQAIEPKNNTLEIACFKQITAATKGPNASILELGCGVGLAGIYLSRRFKCKALLTDFEDSLEPLVTQNMRSLAVEKHCAFQILDWNTSEIPNEIKEQRASVIVAADVLYEKEHIDLVPTIASRIMKETGAELFILADPERYCYHSALQKLHDTFLEVTRVTTFFDSSRESEAPQKTSFPVHLHFCRFPKDLK